MKVKIYNQNIIHLIFKNQKELTLTLCRPQEFYECNSTKLRGKVFTFDQFIDHYTDEEGYLTYFSYWSGFNLPGEVLEEFYNLFMLTDREQKVKQITDKFKGKSYYVIAAKNGDSETLKHELVHAHYYLDPVYKQEANVLVKHMRPELRKQISSALKELGYSQNVMIDEINAYMSTSGNKYLRDDLELDVSRSDIKPFEDLAKRILRD
jgi:hypothetical protein